MTSKTAQQQTGIVLKPFSNRKATRRRFREARTHSSQKKHNDGQILSHRCEPSGRKKCNRACDGPYCERSYNIRNNVYQKELMRSMQMRLPCGRQATRQFPVAKWHVFRYCYGMNEERTQPSVAVRGPYLKADLIAELATVTGLTKRKTDLLLGMLAQIAYREARTGFTVPGICRLDVTHRKARRARIPRTGEQIMIGAHDMLRVRPLRKAKHAVTPMLPGLVQLVGAEEPPTASAAADAAPASAPGSPAPSTGMTGSATPAVGVPEPAPVSGELQPPPANVAVPSAAPVAGQNNPDGLVSFRCGACGQEIEAPFDMAGTTSECPACGGTLEVPYLSEPGTIWGRALPNAAPSLPAAGAPPTEDQLAATHAAMKSRTIRIELPDDL